MNLGSLLGWNVVDAIFGGIKTLFYFIWTLMARIVDVIEDAFYVLAGITNPTGRLGSSEVSELEFNNNVSPKGGNDIVSWLINSPSVQTVFKNLIVIAVALVMFFTILKIIQEQYKNKDGGNPYIVVFRMFKGMLMMLFVTTAVLVGIQVSGVVLMGLKQATGLSKSSGASGAIFRAMSYNANPFRAGLASVNSGSSYADRVTREGFGFDPNGPLFGQEEEEPQGHVFGDDAPIGAVYIDKSKGKRTQSGTDIEKAGNTADGLNSDDELRRETAFTYKPITIKVGNGPKFIAFSSAGDCKVKFTWVNLEKEKELAGQGNVLFNYAIEPGSTEVSQSTRPIYEVMKNTTSGFDLSKMTGFNFASAFDENPFVAERFDFLGAYFKWLGINTAVLAARELVMGAYTKVGLKEFLGTDSGVNQAIRTFCEGPLSPASVLKGPWLKGFMLMGIQAIMNANTHLSENGIPRKPYKWLDGYTLEQNRAFTYVEKAAASAVNFLMGTGADKAILNIMAPLLGFGAEVIDGSMAIAGDVTKAYLGGVESLTIKFPVGEQISNAMNKFYENAGNYAWPDLGNGVGNSSMSISMSDLNPEQQATVVRTALAESGFENDADLTGTDGYPTRSALKALGLVERSALDFPLPDNQGYPARVYTFGDTDGGIMELPKMGVTGRVDLSEGDKATSQKIIDAADPVKWADKDVSGKSKNEINAERLDSLVSTKPVGGAKNIFASHRATWGELALINKWDIYTDEKGNEFVKTAAGSTGAVDSKEVKDEKGNKYQYKPESLDGAAGTIGLSKGNGSATWWDRKVISAKTGEEIAALDGLQKASDLWFDLKTVSVPGAGEISTRMYCWVSSNQNGDGYVFSHADASGNDENGETVISPMAFTYLNVSEVANTYNMSQMDMIIGFLGISIVLGVYLNFMFALVQRLIELVVLYIMSPITLAMYPFDNGSSFEGKFMKPFYQKVISTYAVILSINIFFMLWPMFDNITWVEGSFSNICIKVFVTLAFLGLLPKIRESIAGMLGAENLQAKSISQVAKDAKANAIDPALNIAKGAARLAKHGQDLGHGAAKWWGGREGRKAAAEKYRAEQKASGKSKLGYALSAEGRASWARQRQANKAASGGYEHGLFSALGSKISNAKEFADFKALGRAERDKRFDANDAVQNAKVKREGNWAAETTGMFEQTKNNAGKCLSAINRADMKDEKGNKIFGADSDFTDEAVRKKAKDALANNVDMRQADLELAEETGDKKAIEDAKLNLARAQSAQKDFNEGSGYLEKDSARFAMVRGGKETMSKIALATNKIEDLNNQRDALDPNDSKGRADLDAKIKAAETELVTVRNSMDDYAFFKADKEDKSRQMVQAYSSSAVIGEIIKRDTTAIGTLNRDALMALHKNPDFEAAQGGDEAAAKRIETMFREYANASSADQIAALNTKHGQDPNSELVKFMTQNPASANDMSKFFHHLQPGGIGIGGAEGAIYQNMVKIAISQKVQDLNDGYAKYYAQEADRGVSQARAQTGSIKESLLNNGGEVDILKGDVKKKIDTLFVEAGELDGKAKAAKLKEMKALEDKLGELEAFRTSLNNEVDDGGNWAENAGTRNKLNDMLSLIKEIAPDRGTSNFNVKWGPLNTVQSSNSIIKIATTKATEAQQNAKAEAAISNVSKAVMARNAESKLPTSGT